MSDQASEQNRCIDEQKCVVMRRHEICASINHIVVSQLCIADTHDLIMRAVKGHLGIEL